jgi:hypothetical protein
VCGRRKRWEPADAPAYLPLAVPVPRVPGFIGLGKIGCGLGAGAGDEGFGLAIVALTLSPGGQCGQPDRDFGDQRDDRASERPRVSSKLMLKSFREGQLVTVAAEGGTLDGIVVHVSSLVKLEAAVAEPERGPVFVTVHPKSLTARTEAGPADEALHRFIRRTATPGRAGPRGQPGQGRRGHTRAAGHRTTGK